MPSRVEQHHQLLGVHEEIHPLHAVLGNHLINTNRHGLKFDYVMGNGMHEWAQVLIWPLYWLDKNQCWKQKSAQQPHQAIGGLEGRPTGAVCTVLAMVARMCRQLLRHAPA